MGEPYNPTVRTGYCCDDLRYHVEQTCPDHADPFACPDIVIVRTKGGEYGLPVHDGGSSFIKVQHCPWCGARLITSA